MDLIIVGLIIALAAAYAIKRIYTTVTKPGCDNCNCGCEGCKIHGEEIDLNK